MRSGAREVELETGRVAAVAAKLRKPRLGLVGRELLDADHDVGAAAQDCSPTGDQPHELLLVCLRQIRICLRNVGGIPPFARAVFLQGIRQ